MAKEKSVPHKNEAKSGLSQIHYTIQILDLNKHYFGVKAQIQTDLTDLQLSLPTWSPGSYMIRDYSTHLHKFTAKDPITGANIHWERSDLHSFSIQNPPKVIEIEYIIYAYEDYTVRTNYLVQEFGFINPPAFFLYPNDHLSTAVTVEFDCSDIFPYVYTSLISEGTNKFKASNFDELYDSPFALSKLTSLHFVSEGTDHELLIEGDVPYSFKEKLTSDLQKITSAQIQWMGSSPNQRYLFVLNLSQAAYGGLEHKSSSINFFNPELIYEEDEYKKLLELLSHEYFHLWNVKRIRPIALGPFDYQKPNLTKELWIAEGFTSFYDAYFLLLTGFLKPDEYLQKIHADLMTLEETEAEEWMSLEEASFTAWTKYYKRNANSHNVNISYYTKGAILALCMNLHLLKHSANQKTMRDVFQTLFQEYALKKDRGFTKMEFFGSVLQTTGVDLRKEFADCIEQTKTIPIMDYLEYIGVERILADEIGDFGFKVKERNGSLWVQKIYHRKTSTSLDIQLEDEILAINGRRAQTNLWNKMEKSLAPGERYHVHLSRNGKILERVFEAQKTYKTNQLRFQKHVSENVLELRKKFLEGWI